MFQLTNDPNTVIQILGENRTRVFNSSSRFWEEFEEWKAQGNTPLAADENYIIEWGQQ